MAQYPTEGQPQERLPFLRLCNIRFFEGSADDDVEQTAAAASAPSLGTLWPEVGTMGRMSLTPPPVRSPLAPLVRET
jgi:hypothetical protein